MPTWIVPPPWAWAAVPVNAGDPEDLDPAPFIVAANAFVIRKDLKVHFYDHNFAVDVDDDYRIVVLRDMGDVQALLPTHLPQPLQHNNADAEFFRLHLRYSLNFMVLGGDISDTYPPGRIVRLMEELGVRGQEDDSEMVPLSDPRWHSELGQAIFADVLETRANFSLYHSESKDSDDSDSAPPEFFEQPPEASNSTLVFLRALLVLAVNGFLGRWPSWTTKTTPTRRLLNLSNNHQKHQEPTDSFPGLHTLLSLVLRLNILGPLIKCTRTLLLVVSRKRCLRLFRTS
ncbi:hypothetical protein C8F01DRAFT_383283 [Mycena amicta]|nr:hypothetical protein C8F01DRAFT_383283 [Mycena amicta]